MCFHPVALPIEGFSGNREQFKGSLKGWMRPNVGSRENGDHAMKSGERLGRRFGKTVVWYLRVVDDQDLKLMFYWKLWRRPRWEGRTRSAGTGLASVDLTRRVKLFRRNTQLVGCEEDADPESRTWFSDHEGEKGYSNLKPLYGASAF